MLYLLSNLLGPVSPSDGVDGADVSLLMSLCREDGLLLKPDKPARALDAECEHRRPCAIGCLYIMS